MRWPRIATHKFFYFYIKKRDLTNIFDLFGFTAQYCFLFRFVCIELVSLIWFLQIWVAIYVYGIMINWSTLIKKLLQTYIVKISGSILNLSTVQFKWHLTSVVIVTSVLTGTSTVTVTSFWPPSLPPPSPRPLPFPLPARQTSLDLIRSGQFLSAFNRLAALNENTAYRRLV